MDDLVRPSHQDKNNDVNIKRRNSEKVIDENLISMLPKSLVNDIVNINQHNENEHSENEFNNSTKPFEEDKYSYTMEDSQQINNPSFNDFKSYPIFYPNGKYYSQELKGKAPTPQVTLPSQMASSINIWTRDDFTIFSPELTKFNPNPSSNNANKSQVKPNGENSLPQKYGSYYEDFDNQGSFFANPQINQTSPPKNYIPNNNSPTNQQNFHGCNYGNGMNYGNFQDLNPQPQPHPTQNYSSPQNYYCPYKPFYPKNTTNNNKFSKPQRNYQSQEFGHVHGSYIINEMSNPYSNSCQNIVQLPKNPYEALDSNSSHNIISMQPRNPETREGNFTQGLPIMKNSQEFSNSTQFPGQIAHKYSMDVNNQNFTNNTFQMNELMTEVPNYSPQKKYSEGLQNNGNNIKFNSKTMSIMEKKNRDDTKNLTDFLNSLDEDLIDYVRTQKGSR